LPVIALAQSKSQPLASIMDSKELFKCFVPPYDSY